jgi:hypothetical protein
MIRNTFFIITYVVSSESEKEKVGEEKAIARHTRVKRSN